MTRLILAILALAALTAAPAGAETAKAKADRLLRSGAPKAQQVTKPTANPFANSGATAGRLNPYTSKTHPGPTKAKSPSSLKGGKCLNGIMSC